MVFSHEEDLYYIFFPGKLSSVCMLAILTTEAMYPLQNEYIYEVGLVSKDRERASFNDWQPAKNLQK